MVKLETKVPFFFPQKQHFLCHSNVFLFSNAAVGSWEIHSPDTLDSQPGRRELGRARGAGANGAGANGTGARSALNCKPAAATAKTAQTLFPLPRRAA